MLRLPGEEPLPSHLRGAWIALGNFDGVHLGHQAVIGRALAHARAAGAPVLAGSFDPHPVRLFRPDAPPMALQRLDQRLEALAALGVDATIIWRFDPAFAARTAAAFEDELAGRLGVRGVVTGWDFTFGRGREGTVATLARETRFEAEAVPPVSLDGPPVSSTRIRQALRDGQPGEAARLLTRPFTIRGGVIRGAQLGRTLGFPTANMALGDYVRPAYGVYAVRVRLPDGEWRDGVANLGVRPMIEPPVELLETWILDWTGDLYDHQIDVEIIAFIRPEARFDSLDMLSRQVREDAARARLLLGQRAKG
jgi:riboflavin kinase/FMN adenylyltransferase